MRRAGGPDAGRRGRCLTWTIMRALWLVVALATGSTASGCQRPVVGLSTDLDATSTDEVVIRRGAPAPNPDAGLEASAASLEASAAPAKECPEGGFDAGGWQDVFAVGNTYDGSTCRGALIRASDYNQSCTTDSDCVEVGEGNTCDEVCGISCGGQAINRCALPRYETDLAATGFVGNPACNCPADFGACCRGGRCVDDVCCLNPCPDAGGR